MDAGLIYFPTLILQTKKHVGWQIQGILGICWPLSIGHGLASTSIGMTGRYWVEAKIDLSFLPSAWHDAWCNLLLWSTLCFTVFAVDKYTYSYLLWQCRQAWGGKDTTHTRHKHKHKQITIVCQISAFSWLWLSSCYFFLILTSWWNLFAFSWYFSLQLVGWLGTRMLTRLRRREGGRVLGTSSTIPTRSSTIPTWGTPPTTRLASLLQLLSWTMPSVHSISKMQTLAQNDNIKHDKLRVLTQDTMIDVLAA